MVIAADSSKSFDRKKLKGKAKHLSNLSRKNTKNCAAPALESTPDVVAQVAPAPSSPKLAPTEPKEATKPLKRQKRGRNNNFKSKADIPLSQRYKVKQPFKIRTATLPKEVDTCFGFGGYTRVKKPDDAIKLGPPSGKMPSWRTLSRIQNRAERVRQATPRKSAFLAALATRRSWNPRTKDSVSQKTIGPSRGFVPVLKGKTFPSEKFLLNLVKKNEHLPYVPCRSTAKSFNVGVNLQSALSLIKSKKKRLIKGKSDFGCLSDNNSFRELAKMYTISEQEPEEQPSDVMKTVVRSKVCSNGKHTVEYGQFYAEFAKLSVHNADSDVAESDLKKLVEGLFLDWEKLKQNFKSIEEGGSTMDATVLKTTLEGIDVQIKVRRNFYQQVTKLCDEAQKLLSRSAALKKQKVRTFPARKTIKDPLKNLLREMQDFQKCFDKN